MKRFCIFCFVACVFACVVFTGCDKEDDDFVVKASVTNGSAYNSKVDIVKAVVYPGENSLTESAYKSGGFTIELPKTLADTYLGQFDEDYLQELNEFGIEVSDATAKSAAVYFEGYKSGSYFGDFILAKYEENETETPNTYTMSYMAADASYIYVDKNLSMKGSFNEKLSKEDILDLFDEEDIEMFDNFNFEIIVSHDNSLKKGWNILYEIMEQVLIVSFTSSGANANFKLTVTNTTKNPGGMKWYSDDEFYEMVYGDGDSKSYSPYSKALKKFSLQPKNRFFSPPSRQTFFQK